MTAIDMIKLMNRTPFEPLEIRLTDGTHIHIEHPYEIATTPNSQTCVVYVDEDATMRIVSYRNITEVVTPSTAG